MTRLETVSSDLVEKLRHSAASKQRAAALAACRFAVSKADVAQVAAAEALETIQKSGTLSGQQKAALDALVAQLDEEYFQLQEAAEEGRASTDDYLKVFGQARAVAALTFAGGDDPFDAATEAIYEATATTDDQEELLTLVEAEL
jgi:hypothetical protein